MIESDDSTSCFQVMVELTTRKREISVYGGYHHETFELKRFSCASQVTIPDTSGTNPNPVCGVSPIRAYHNTIRQVVPLIFHSLSYPPRCSYLHSPSLPFSSSTIPSPDNTKLSHRSLSLHAIYEKLTPSTAYTKYSIHQLQHTPSSVYTKYCIQRSTAYTEYSIHPRLFVFPSCS